MFYCFLPIAVSKNAIRKTGHLACLREMTGQTYLIYASSSNFSRASFQGTFFGIGKQGFSKKRLKEKTSKVQSLERVENLICNLWKLFIYISNYYHSKRSSRRCFQGNDFHYQVTGFVHVFSYVFFFFLPSTIFLISPS